jgi:PTH1 family peptidyl-tRNA hydrolase
MKPAFLIVGLGNPGKQYERTRHNAGWLALDHVASAWGAGEWKDQQKFLCVAAEAVFQGESVLLVKPSTFMNRSGECIRKLIDFYKLDPAKQLLVVCDDIDLPLGTHRLRMTGGPGTHNGLKSVIECIGENFPRHRIGLGSAPVGLDLATWVLSALSQEEAKELRPALEAVEASYLTVRKERE